MVLTSHSTSVTQHKEKKNAIFNKAKWHVNKTYNEPGLKPIEMHLPSLRNNVFFRLYTTIFVHVASIFLLGEKVTALIRLVGIGRFKFIVAFYKACHKRKKLLWSWDNIIWLPASKAQFCVNMCVCGHHPGMSITTVVDMLYAMVRNKFSKICFS